MTKKLIYLEDAIDALTSRWLKTINYDGKGEDIAEECRLCLMNMPSAQPTQTNADPMQGSVLDCVRRQQAIDEIQYIGRLATLEDGDSVIRVSAVEYILQNLPSAQTEYKPVTAEDFAKTMSESTLYQYMAWYGWALALMKEQRFVICKKTM